MKNILFCLFFISMQGFSQSLESIHTRAQVEELMESKFKFREMKYDSFIVKSDTIGMDVFRAGDVNQDGFKDFLVAGKGWVSTKYVHYDVDEIFILLGGKKRTKKISLSNDYFRTHFNHKLKAEMINLNKEVYVILRYDTMNVPTRQKAAVSDTLFIQSDHPMLYRQTASEKEISKVEFKTSNCYAPCPVFEIAVSSDLLMKYRGISSARKDHTVKIKDTDWNYLQSMLRKMRVEELKDKYRIYSTDSRTLFLTVYFKDGTIKKIEDYGGRGNYGLSLVYDFLFELSNL